MKKKPLHRFSYAFRKRFMILILFAGFCWVWMAAAYADSREAGSTAAETKNNLLVIPFPIYTPETRAAMTLTGMYHFRDGDAGRPAMFMAFLAYSQQNQFRLAANGRSWLAGERLHASGGIGFSDWPDRFYGIGVDNTEDDEEKYTLRELSMRFDLQHRIVRNWKAGGGLDFRRWDLSDTLGGGLLESGGIAGAEGGHVFGMGPVATYDSRDDAFFPRAGRYVRLSAAFFPNALSDYRFRRFRADFRRYVPVGDHGVLALRQYASLVRGDAPFMYLSKIGDMGASSLGRGYYSGLFRERDLGAVQAEYRTRIRGRLGGALFAEAAVIGYDLFRGDDLSIKPSGGAGLRYRIGGGETVNLRLDFAVGKDSTGVYFNILESF